MKLFILVISLIAIVFLIVFIFSAAEMNDKYEEYEVLDKQLNEEKMNMKKLYGCDY